MTAILALLCVTLFSGMYAPRHKGVITPGLHVALVCIGSETQPIYARANLRIETILTAFAIILENMAMRTCPEQG